MNSKMELENEIETLRSKLETMVSQYGLRNEKTIFLSNQLDELINQFNRYHTLNKK